MIFLIGDMRHTEKGRQIVPKFSVTHLLDII
eukprot:CAMPEP_0170813446 /NCGR_PEP_ID=MMETSP0733-20121128/36876_1 /TAXON_ID=186038 /ORGANISM="Fragilariopsis kerguelensis, Strain L26-C5" /LENGTH=30 /DNA_ID= /DNA_START= /DNA_END= /DNA_ORIENTATION=